MDFREHFHNFMRLTLIPALRRMFGKHRKGNTVLLICSFYLIASMLSVICLSHHVNLSENDRLAAAYEQYITSSVTDVDADTSAAALAFNHILSSKIELNAVFVFLMIIWALLSTFSLARIFHATVEQDKYIYGLYVTFGSDTRSIRRRIHTEFLLAALIALTAAIPTATLLTRAVYLQNGQSFRPGIAPYAQILLWLFAVSLAGAAYLSHRITSSTCVELMAALDCSDYTASPRVSRLLNRRLYNGSLRYARLAVTRMRGYYIPLVLTVSMVAAVFFGSMNLALEGERTAVKRVHEYSIEFSRGLSSKELSEGYLDHLMAIDAVESVDALAHDRAERLGTHLLAEKNLFADGASETTVDCGTYCATDNIRILCADSNTRMELGGENMLPDRWENVLSFHERSFNYEQIPESGTVIYLYPEEREAELNISPGDTVQLALPRHAIGASLEEKLADGGYEYLSLTVADVIAVPGVHHVTLMEATYICPRITEDYLLLNPEDYAAVTQSETVEQLALEELYREDLPFGELSAPAVLLLPENYVGPDLSTIQMFAPTTMITEPYSVSDPLDSNHSLYLESDTFFLNRTAYHTYFYLGPSGNFANDAAATEQIAAIEDRSTAKYSSTELTVVDQIICSGLSAPCVILPNNDNFFSSYTGDLCILQLSNDHALYQVHDEIFIFGTDRLLKQQDYIGKQLFLHTEIEAGFFAEMNAQGLYTTYPNESAYDLSSFQILSEFELGGYIYFVCALSDSCNLAQDSYPAYTVPGNDFIFLDGLTGDTELALAQTDSYLMYRDALQRPANGITFLPVGEFAATNDLTVSIADSINADLLTPDLSPTVPAAGEAVLVTSPNSPFALQADDHVQLAIQGDFTLDPNDPQTASLEGIDLLNYLIGQESDFRYITLRIIEVIPHEGTEDILYISETDWMRLRRTDSTYQSLDIYLFGDTDLVSLVDTSSRIRGLIGNWQSTENLVTLTDHNRLWKAVTTGACNYPAIIRLLSGMLILLLPLLWCSPQMMHFHKRREEFAVMNAIGRTNRQIARMIAAECLLITAAAGVFVALLCPFSVLCVQMAILMLELPFETSDFDTGAYLFMIVFVMLCSALSFLTAARRMAGGSPKQKKPKKGADI